MPPLQSCPLPAVQPLLHRVNHPTLAHALHEKAAVKAGIFLSGVDVELVLGDLLRVKEFFPVVGALGAV
jgi:hypothetical protein